MDGEFAAGSGTGAAAGLYRWAGERTYSLVAFVRGLRVLYEWQSCGHGSNQASLAAAFVIVLRPRHSFC